MRLGAEPSAVSDAADGSAGEEWSTQGQHFLRWRHAVGVTPDAVLRDLDGLRALARSLVHGDAETDDLLQDTAIAAITHPPDEERPTRPWLATVLRNRWRMNRRAESRRRAREQTVAADEAEEQRDDPIDRARVLERLSTALVVLDEPFRTTVIRRYLDGESAAEIARTQGVPAGTVRWRLKTGLERLRAALDDAAPRWQRALAPMAAGKGALLVKAKTSIATLVVLVLLLGGVALFVIKGGDDGPTRGPVVAGAAPIGSAAKLPIGVPPKPNEAPAEAPVHDPLPGQGKATLEQITAPGGAVSGRVINWSTGDGVSGAELTFTGAVGAVTVRTKGDGAFELAPDAPGSFALSAASAPGFLPFAPELSHSSVHVGVAKDRAVRGITVFLFPAVDYVGKVVDGKGAPVAGARVRLLGTPQGEQAIDKLEVEWTSDRDGTFVFHAADNAVFEAVAGSARGFGRLDGDVAITKQLVITLGDAPARDATIRGKTIDATGAPIADVLVRGLPDDPPGKEPSQPRAVAFATSGPDGAFVLEGLDRGTYVLIAEAEGRAPAGAENVKGGAKGVTLTLEPGKAIGGTVVTTAGDPVPAFTLVVVKRIEASRQFVLARSIVTPTGRFEIRVPAGDYELIASASGWAPSAATEVTAGTTDAKLTVSLGATVKGVVVDAEKGEPLQYVRVMREGAGGGASAAPANAGTVTRADGTFELTGIPPGPVALSFGGGGHHPKIEGGMTAVDGGVLGPLHVALTKIIDGEKPTLELVGIGVKLAAEGDALRVDMVVPGSGAQAAGIIVGDMVVAVDGLPITKLGVDGAVGKIRGLAGTTISVSVRRGDTIVPLVVERRRLKL